MAPSQAFKGGNMTEPLATPDMDKLLELFTDAIRHRVKALELENEALKIRLNEARVKLELARERLSKLGGDTSELELNTELG